MVQFVEAHTIAWGEVRNDWGLCTRVDDGVFDVGVDIARPTPNEYRPPLARGEVPRARSLLPVTFRFPDAAAA
jgi:hypothetical protein